MRGQQRVHPGKILRRWLRGQRRLGGLTQQAVKLLGGERDAVKVFAVAETQPHRHDLYAEALYLVGRNVAARVGDDGHLAGVVQQPVLALHVIRLLLLDLAEILAGKEHLGRVVDTRQRDHTIKDLTPNQLEEYR